MELKIALRVYIDDGCCYVSSLHQAARPLLQADYGYNTRSRELICDEEKRQLDLEKQSAIGEVAMQSRSAKNSHYCNVVIDCRLSTAVTVGTNMSVMSSQSFKIVAVISFDSG